MASYDQIISNIKAVFSSSDLNTSKVAMFEKIANSIAPVLDNTISEITNTQTIVTDIIGQKQPGKAHYYVQKALEFEYDLVNNIGINLSIDPITKNNVYLIPDATKQIIKIAIFDESKMTLKVAYLNPDTNTLDSLPTAPTNLKQLFDNYFISVAEYAGLPIIKVSDPPNIFTFIAFVTYFSTYDLIALKNNVITAIFAFRDSNPASNGILYSNDLEDYVKNNVPGVRNMALSSTIIDSATFQGSVVLSSGYFNYIMGIENNLIYVAT